MTSTSPAHADNGSPVPVEDLCFLADAFIESGQADKAVAVYESACRLYPDNLALKINLGRARSLRGETLSSPRDILGRDETSRPGEGRDLSANRFQGLGEIFLRHGRRGEAEKIFEISKKSNPSFFLPYLNLGRLHMESGDLQRAVTELEEARRLNPFNDETVDLLGAAYFQTRRYRDALICQVDGLILSGEISNRRVGGKFRAKIKKTMEKLPNITGKERNDLIRERRRRINVLYEELEKEIEKNVPVTFKASPQTEPGPREAPSDAPSRALPPPNDERTSYERAVALKRHLMFRNMPDDAVLKIASFTSEIHPPAGDFIYQEGDAVHGLYLVDHGKVELEKPSPSGPVKFAVFEAGSFFGDDNLLSGRERFTGAVAVTDTDLLFIDKAGLANIFAREREIAIHFLWYFWKSLSFQIRQSNDRMAGFFAGSSEKARKEILAASVATSGRTTHVEIDRKLEVLQTKGLAAKDLHLIAKLSNEEVYNLGEAIFREGDHGDRLYVVLEGSVLISKNIPGAGEEALTLLKKGDFFGEMALIGTDHRRSADAKAQEQGTTLLVITNRVLRETLSINTDSAYQFLTILCRILSQRLLEMNEKIYQWRLISGSFQ